VQPMFVSVSVATNVWLWSTSCSKRICLRSGSWLEPARRSNGMRSGVGWIRANRAWEESRGASAEREAVLVKKRARVRLVNTRIDGYRRLPGADCSCAVFEDVHG